MDMIWYELIKILGAFETHQLLSIAIEAFDLARDDTQSIRPIVIHRDA